MTSYIIVNTDEKERSKIAKTICAEHKIDALDQTAVTLLEKNDVVQKSLGIELIKKMQEKVSLKPFKSPMKAVIIPQAHLLTIPAQNALLKLLEEPPENTLLFLLSDSLGVLLPTIQSRCTIIKETQVTPLLSDEQKQEIGELLTSLNSHNIGVALKTAEQLAKDKEKALHTLGQLIIYSRQTLLTKLDDQDASAKLAATISKLVDAHKTLKTTNTNPRLILEQLFLSI